MSALGHYIEEEGIATVAISLIRAQTEKTKPPRALWVPFELGRPFGPPRDPAFQTRVILAALRLLEREHGPVVIADFPEDDPRERPDPRWRPPLINAAARDGSAAGLADQLETEIAKLEGPYRRSVDARKRTIVGLSGLSIGATGAYIAGCLRGEPQASPSPEMSTALTLRFAVDDLKAYYIEAALDGLGKPASKQLGDWFWSETAAGAAIFTLRKI
ncbi:MAG: hypothetical protein WA633_04115 [Stellaceae bacterium]